MKTLHSHMKWSCFVIATIMLFGLFANGCSNANNKQVDDTAERYSQEFYEEGIDYMSYELYTEAINAFGYIERGTKNYESAVKLIAECRDFLNDDETACLIYITETGSKYHRDECRWLYASRIPITRKKANLNYEPCKVCKP